MAPPHSSRLRRRARPWLLTDLLGYAGSTATADVTSAGAAVNTSAVAAGAPVPSTFQINATTTMWSFFQRFRL
jgi:hypothetical protein